MTMQKNHIHNYTSEKGNKEQKVALLKSQLSWLKTRDLSENITFKIVDNKYPLDGTMYRLMAAGERERLTVSMIKDRTLLFKNWIGALETTY